MAQTRERLIGTFLRKQKPLPEIKRKMKPAQPALRGFGVQSAGPSRRYH
jgi:hypothetical protein